LYYHNTIIIILLCMQILAESVFRQKTKMVSSSIASFGKQRLRLWLLGLLLGPIRISDSTYKFDDNFETTYTLEVENRFTLKQVTRDTKFQKNAYFVSRVTCFNVNRFSTSSV
jgi:hypothetical protein